MNSTWQTLPFHEMSADTLYTVLRLRSNIFVVEQDCAYLDMDNLDQSASHILCWRGNTLAAYQRCLPPGISYPESSIGRIVVDPAHRGSALGSELVQRGIDFNTGTWPDHDILINAQAHLQTFYNALGFIGEGDTHWEDGILHRHMRYVRASTKT